MKKSFVTYVTMPKKKLSNFCFRQLQYVIYSITFSFSPASFTMARFHFSG